MSSEKLLASITQEIKEEFEPRIIEEITKMR